MKPVQYPEQMLKTLVKEYEISGAAEVRAWGIEGRELAVKAGIFSAEVIESALKGYRYELEFSDYVYSLSVNTQPLMEINAAVRYMKTKGWITLLSREEPAVEEGVYSSLKPTPEGIDYAHKIMRTWYRQAWDFFRSDVRTIVVAVITAIIITLLTTLVLRVLGQ
jgi:hypothetical protein